MSGDRWKFTFSWKTQSPETEPDCDVLAFLLDEQRKVPRRYDMAFYNQKTDRSHAVTHLGDDLLTGKGRESLLVQRERIPDFCREIVFWLSVHEADSKKQELKMLEKVQVAADGGLDEQPLEMYVLPIGKWEGKQAAALVSLKRQPDGAWLLTASEETALEDWRATAVLAHYGLVRWKE